MRPTAASALLLRRAAASVAAGAAVRPRLLHAAVAASSSSSSSLLLRTARPSAPAVAAASTAPVARAFSAAAAARSHGKGDRDLEHKLAEEFKYESTNEDNAEPEVVRDYLAKGVFKLETKVGDKEATLTRTFGNEKVSVIFSTDSLSEETAEEGDGEEESGAVPIPLTVVVEKRVSGADHGALELSVTLEDGSFFIDAASFFPSSSVAADTTAEGDWQRRGLYGGPVFGELDEGLQDLFHDFLQDRGIDEELAEFLPRYIEFKEASEYTEWLRRVGEWVAK
ncbi:Mitochondrial acidic protein mam33 [Cladochytrium tenue]|nr:Mitochondrial acidic protein mam33 [Cladochytrium tenue]